MSDLRWFLRDLMDERGFGHDLTRAFTKSRDAITRLPRIGRITCAL